MARLRDGDGLCDSAGVRIWYRVEGAEASGTPMVFMHGGPGATARPFERTIGPLLAGSRPVVYLDVRGCGRSDRPDDSSAYSLVALTADLESLRRHLGIHRWVLFGHSLGGAVVAAYAAAHPDRAAALVLCAPRLDGTTWPAWSVAAKVALAPAPVAAAARAIYHSQGPTLRAFESLLSVIDRWDRAVMQFFEPDIAAVLDALQEELFEEIGQPLMDPRLPMSLERGGLMRFDAFALLGRLAMPQLVLSAAFDSEVNVADAVRYVASAPDAELVLFHRSGHHPYLEETAACAGAIDAFLERRGL